jgi:hypothetical protein
MTPKWKDLYEFINKKIEKEGQSFLENDLYIEMVSPEGGNPSYTKETDSEGWTYVQPCWKIGKEIHVHTTTFRKKRIVTLNINY